MVDVASVTNGTENGTQSVTVTLADNDAQPSVSLTLVGSSLVENGGVDTVRATLSNPSTQDVTVTLGFTRQRNEQHRLLGKLERDCDPRRSNERQRHAHGHR